MAEGFSRDKIVKSLEELGRRLELAGERAELYIVGGEAMALAFARDRVTRDIDAVFVPKSRVYDEAKAMSVEDDTLGPDWLNDAVKGFLPSIEDSEAQVVLDVPGIRVLVASPRRLLAMKVFAARVDRDRDDILTLCEQSNIRTITEVLELTQELYGDLLTPKSKFLTIELLQENFPMS
jgi:predicted nucleotidyltransferase